MLLGGLLTPLPGEAQAPPHERWSTVETETFRITYPRDASGMEAVVERTARLAEAAYREMAEAFVDPPSGTIELLLTDHADFAQGFARTFPSNQIVLFLPPPVDGFALSHFDEWLNLVLVHELAHIFHLDRTSGLGGLGRSVLGRVPMGWPLFPNRSQPRWAVEGVATYYESGLTHHGGRAHGTAHEMVLRVAALEGRLERLDQALGQSPVWPAGDRPYLYGARFFQHLIEEYGEGAVAAYTEAVVRQWIPYRMNAAARAGLGVSFSEAWEAWVRGLEEEARALADSLAGLAPLTRPEPLTREGRFTLHPASGSGSDSMVYFRSDGLSDPQLRQMAPDGSGDRFLMRVNGGTVPSVDSSGRVLFSQLEYQDPYHLYGDLYLRQPGGEVGRITRGARLSQPSFHPGGGEAVAVQEGEGTNRLVRVELEGGEVEPLVEGALERHWAYPRWSPDGRWIAAARWSREGRFQVVVLDGETGELLHTLPEAGPMDTSPSWSPDGSHLLWSSDRTGIANLYAVSVNPETAEPGPVRQVTNLLGGALFPSVDAQGRWILFSSYGADGWDLVRIPFDPRSWMEPLPRDPRYIHEESSWEPPAVQVGEARDYSPVRTLLPRYWEPWLRAGEEAEEVEVVAPAAGIRTSGRDLLERHRYSGVVLLGRAPSGNQWWGRASYEWAGLATPILGISYEREHEALSPFTALVGEEEREERFYPHAREESMVLSSLFTHRRVRRVANLLVSGRHLTQRIHLLDGEGARSPFEVARPRRTFLEARVSGSVSTARRHAFSVGAEKGAAATVRLRERRERALPDSLVGVRGRDGGFRDAVGVVQAYRGVSGPGYANHVLAFRGAVGAGTGSGAGPGHFRVGGASGGRDPFLPGGPLTGTAFLFPTRGYPSGVRSGSRAWSASLEYRFPLVILHRGWGAFPFHLDRLSGGLFLDAAGAWGPDPREVGEGTVSSAGAELSLEALPFWLSATTFRAGVAAPLDGTTRPSLHFRIGRAF